MAGREGADVSLQEWARAVHRRVPLEQRQCAVASVIAVRQNLTVDAVGDLDLVVEENVR